MREGRAIVPNLHLVSVILSRLPGKRSRSQLRDMEITLLEPIENFKGQVLTPGQDGFVEACACWNLTVQQTPDMVVLPMTTSDVQAAIRYADAHGLKVTVQTTGHGQPRNCSHGMLINMGHLHAVEVDAASRTALIQGGALWKHVIEPAFEVGLAPLSGSSPDVGVVGYLLGGGIAIMARTHGLGIDSMVSCQIVTPDGELRTASATENADLFWAIRGGGGAFGVITEVTLRLVESPFIYGGSMLFPAARAEEVLTAFARWTQNLSSEATMTATIMNFPPVPFVPEPVRGKAFVIVMGVICADEARGQDLLRPMTDLAPMMNDFQMLPYTASAAVYKDPVDPLPAGGRGVLLKALPETSIGVFLKAVGPIETSPNLMIAIRHIGNRADQNSILPASMDALRSGNYILFCLGVPMGPDASEAMNAQAERIFGALGGDVLCRGPLNWIGEGTVSREHIDECFGAADRDRIGKLKSAYDVRNTFANASVGIDR